jgi:hypothetical protein
MYCCEVLDFFSRSQIQFKKEKEKDHHISSIYMVQVGGEKN